VNIVAILNGRRRRASLAASAQLEHYVPVDSRKTNLRALRAIESEESLQSPELSPLTSPLGRAQLSEAYAGNHKSRGQFMQVYEALAHDLALSSGFRPTHEVDNQFGNVTRYYHQNGDNLIVTELPESLRDRGAPWETRWETHSKDGVKSTGFDLESLQNHLKNYCSKGQ
jgi:hypothetical protein